MPIFSPFTLINMYGLWLVHCTNSEWERLGVREHSLTNWGLVTWDDFWVITQQCTSKVTYDKRWKICGTKLLCCDRNWNNHKWPEARLLPDGARFSFSLRCLRCETGCHPLSPNQPILKQLNDWTLNQPIIGELFLSKYLCIFAKKMLFYYHPIDVQPPQITINVKSCLRHVDS